MHLLTLAAYKSSLNLYPIFKFKYPIENVKHVSLLL
jgi:hypothetical protein